MTLEQIQALTDDEIRVRVAKLAGWEPIEDVYGYPPDPDYVRGYEGQGMLQLPNYPADLNACAEMEKRWTGDLKRPFNNPAVNREWKTYQMMLDGDIHATARQRCEAFLAVMHPVISEEE